MTGCDFPPFRVCLLACCLLACCLLAKPVRSTLDTKEGYKTKTGSTSPVSLTLTLEAAWGQRPTVRGVEASTFLILTTGAVFTGLGDGGCVVLCCVVSCCGVLCRISRMAATHTPPTWFLFLQKKAEQNGRWFWRRQWGQCTVNGNHGRGAGGREARRCWSHERGRGGLGSCNVNSGSTTGQRSAGEIVARLEVDWIGGVMRGGREADWRWQWRWTGARTTYLSALAATV